VRALILSSIDRAADITRYCEFRPASRVVLYATAKPCGNSLVQAPQIAKVSPIAVISTVATTISSGSWHRSQISSGCSRAAHSATVRSGVSGVVSTIRSNSMVPLLTESVLPYTIC
jgi:hypothetical protein